MTTLLQHVEETFGPVKCIVRVNDIEAAIDCARHIESGICHVNGPTVHDEAQMPFGGKAGIHEFTELRWITVQTPPRHYPF